MGLSKTSLTLVEADEANAFQTGLSYLRSEVFITKPLINLLSEKEILSIIAHELAHIQRRHILKAFIKTQMVIFTISYIPFETIGLIIGPEFYKINYPISISIMIAWAALFIPLWFVAWLIMMYYLRKYEYEADKIVVKITSQPQPFIDSLKKLEDEISKTQPHARDHLGLFSTHPPLKKRIARIIAINGY